jgi:hypothetical protein
VVAFVFAFVISTLSAGGAFGCSTSNHCYGIVRTQPFGIDGIVANIDPSCMYSASNNFITSEVWLVTSDASHWVEVGYINNQTSINGLSQGLLGFWGDLRPVDGTFHGHVLVTNPSLVNRSASVQRSSSSSFQVNFGGVLGSSTNNSMSTDHGDIGSETTSSSGSGSESFYSSMEYRAGTWSNQLATPITLITQAPQTQAWSTQLKSMYAGVPC